MSARRIVHAMAGGLLVLGLLVAALPVAAQVSVRSTVSKTTLERGEPVEWMVVLSGVGSGDAPRIPELDWAVVLPLGTSQSMSLINGRMSARTVYQFRVIPTREGRFEIPSVSVRVGGLLSRTDAIPVEVLAPQGGGASGLAEETRPADRRLRLVASLSPREVVVGQPVILTMRLYQGVRLLSAPIYVPPPTPRFYSEKSGPVHSAYVTEAGSRWLVGETQTVLYPTLAGRLTVGAAHVVCLVEDRDRLGGVEVEVESRPVSVDVRPLPAAPASAAGGAAAVADVFLSGTVDRAAVRADEAVQVTLRLSGSGNLRLAGAPAFPELADFQVFDRRVEDSLEVEDGPPRGSKIVRYTLLPRRPGPLVIPAISYVTFVPGVGFRMLSWPGTRVDVAPGLARDTTTPAAARAARLVPTGRPGGSPWTAARPFVGAALVFFALALWLGRVRLRRRIGSAESPGTAARAPDPVAASRLASEAAARLARHRAALDEARGRGDAGAFWREAESALAELAARLPDDGGGDAAIASRIAAARYAPGGSAAAAMEGIAPGLAARLASAQEQSRRAARGQAPRAARIAGGVLVGLGLALLAMGALRVASHPDDAALAKTLAAAAAELSANDIPAARARLLAAWTAGARRPGVAIDLALAAWYERQLGEAALWTERARRLDPRHPRVITLAEALQEEGAWEGLPVGARARTTGGEIAFAACLLLATALLVFVLGRRRAAARWAGRFLVVMASALAIYAGQSGAAGEAAGRGVILRPVSLSPAPGQPGDVELEAGRAVWLEGREQDGFVPVRIGSQVRGFVPGAAVREL